MGQCAVLGAGVTAATGLKLLRPIQPCENSDDLDVVRAAQPAIDSGLEREYLLEAWDSTFISGAAGAHLKKFEDTFPPLCGCKYGVACSNGTVAIDLVLKALNIQPGEEVSRLCYMLLACLL